MRGGRPRRETAAIAQSHPCATMCDHVQPGAARCSQVKAWTQTTGGGNSCQVRSR